MPSATGAAVQAVFLLHKLIILTRGDSLNCANGLAGDYCDTSRKSAFRDAICDLSLDQDGT